MSNEKLNIPDTYRIVMGDESKMRLRKETLARARELKFRGNFASYDDWLNYLMDKCPITAPVSGEGGE